MSNKENDIWFENLEEITNYAKKIEGCWDGDEAGLAEERAAAAGELISAIEEVKILISEIK